MEALMVLLAKLGTMIVDRRLIYTLISLAILIGLVPATVDADKMSEETAAALEMILKGVGVLVGQILLIYSWTKRPPSGKSFAAEKLQADAVYRAIMDAIKKG